MFASNTSAANGAATYIEDVFSTYLYTGNGSTQTITNGIDLAGKGGLVWTKSRSNVSNNTLIDTVRGGNFALVSNLTNGQGSGYGVTFSSTGYSTASNIASGQNYASWTFREQAKFFDVVTYTGDGASSKTISHNLNGTVGCVIIKNYSDAAQNWQVYHRASSATPNRSILNLNTTAAVVTVGVDLWASTNTTFTIDANTGQNVNGQTYVAYLFAHNAGGFGLTGTDNVISCGEFTAEVGTGNFTVNLGYEPQWILYKRTDSTDAWRMVDNMRGIPVTSNGVQKLLYANTSGAELDGSSMVPTATGFQQSGGGGFGGGANYIYIAIRRGPMKTPTSGTSVFTPYEVPASPTTGAITGFVTDAGFIGQRAGADKFRWGARLMGNPTLNSTNTNVESANTNQIWDRMNGWWNSAINGYMTWGFKRAPGFMDVVCYTGDNSTSRTLSHNLTVLPELVIVKCRSSANEGTASGWYVAAKNPSDLAWRLQLNTTSSASTYQAYSGKVASSSWFNPYEVTSSYVSPSPTGPVGNLSGYTYVAYLFASCPGVSKVGSFTMSASTFNVDCGFTAGARFILLKNTTNALGWLVWDSARGIVSGNDPMLILNSTAAEDATYGAADWIDPYAAGFTVNGSLFTSGTYIYLAIA